MTARRWLPWVLLLVAAVVAVTVLGRSSRVPEPGQGDADRFTPAPGSGPSAAGAQGASTQAAAPSASASSGLPPMSLQEARDFHMHIAHEQCEDGVKRINVLEGKPPTDPGNLQFLEVCLRIGNVAWYKCILGSDTRPQAAVCNRRFMSLDSPP